VKVHPLYKKRFVVRKKYYAHDEKNVSKLGDVVRIRETAPISKMKKWKLIEVVTK
jgi:small subunit ribosomal protein S17